ncbi:unnamed protein product, partial [Discosporangium mesarthrocarpum]
VELAQHNGVQPSLLLCVSGGRLKCTWHCHFRKPLDFTLPSVRTRGRPRGRRNTTKGTRPMLSLRPVGSLIFEATGRETPSVLPHPSEAGVVLVSRRLASEHDSFTGACKARVNTPAEKGDGTQLLAATGDADLAPLATTVMGKGRKAVLVQFLHHQSSLSVSDLTSGTYRGLVPLRLTPGRSAAKNPGTGGVTCMAGTRTPCSGLVFLGRTGLTAMQAVQVDPWDSIGAISLSLGERGTVSSLACHPSRCLVAACLSEGSVGLWDYSTVGSGGGL